MLCLNYYLWILWGSTFWESLHPNLFNCEYYATDVKNANSVPYNGLLIHRFN